MQRWDAHRGQHCSKSLPPRTSQRPDHVHHVPNEASLSTRGKNPTPSTQLKPLTRALGKLKQASLHSNMFRQIKKHIWVRHQHQAHFRYRKENAWTRMILSDYVALSELHFNCFVWPLASFVIRIWGIAWIVYCFVPLILTSHLARK